MTTPAATTALNIENCPARLSAEHVASYQANGFLAFSDFLTAQEVADLNDDMAAMVRSLYEKAKSGELPVKRGNWDNMRNYSGYKISEGDEKPSLLLEPDVEFDPRTASFDLVDQSYRKISYMACRSAAFKALSENPRLIAFLEALLGPKPIVYGDQALCKPARIGSAKPWHQDSAYFNYAPYDAGVDVWIALDDAEVENGCMFVLPGGHKQGPKRHIHRDDCLIDEGRLDYSHAAPVELQAGGILLFSVLLPHYTPPNHSDRRRRAAQLFYRGGNTKLVTPAEHYLDFREADGTPAACSAVKG
jgi:phytanoyl-CoA hydroxylase